MLSSYYVTITLHKRILSPISKPKCAALINLKLFSLSKNMGPKFFNTTLQYHKKSQNILDKLTRVINIFGTWFFVIHFFWRVMSQPSSCLHFLRFHFLQLLKSCLFLFTEKRRSTSSKVKHLQFRYEKCYF